MPSRVNTLVDGPILIPKKEYEAAIDGPEETFSPAGAVLNSALSPTEQLIRNSSPCENWMVDVAYHLINHPIIGKLCNIRVDKDGIGAILWMDTFDKNNFKKSIDDLVDKIICNIVEEIVSSGNDTFTYFKNMMLLTGELSKVMQAERSLDDLNKLGLSGLHLMDITNFIIDVIFSCSNTIWHKTQHNATFCILPRSIEDRITAANRFRYSGKDHECDTYIIGHLGSKGSLDVIHIDNIDHEWNNIIVGATPAPHKAFTYPDFTVLTLNTINLLPNGNIIVSGDVTISNNNYYMVVPTMGCNVNA